MARETYLEKLRDPRWQKKRLRILKRDEWRCCGCGSEDKTLHVHHLQYKGEPWEVQDSWLQTLCETCHAREKEDRDDAEAFLLQELRFSGLTVNDLYGLADSLPVFTQKEIKERLDAIAIEAWRRINDINKKAGAA